MMSGVSRNFYVFRFESIQINVWPTQIMIRAEDYILNDFPNMSPIRSIEYLAGNDKLSHSRTNQARLNLNTQIDLHLKCLYVHLA